MLTEFFALLSAVTVTVALIYNFPMQLISIIVLYFLTVRLLEKFSVGNYSEKAVLITGCGSGFGFALVLRCLSEGMTVFATFHSDKGKKNLQDAAKAVKNSDQLLHVITMDVTDEESIKQARIYVDEHLPNPKNGLWGLVNNAGQIGIGWDDWQTPDHYLYSFKVNTLGMIRVTHAFKDLVKISRGRIIVMSSILGKVPMPIMGAYCISKFGTSCYTDILRNEIAHAGVTVVGIEAGFFKTPITYAHAAAEKVKKLWEDAPEQIHKEYGNGYFDWTLKYMDAMEDFGDNDLNKVTDAYFSSLTSCFPRHKWQIGNDAVYALTPFSFLPTRWQDFCFQIFLRFVQKQPETQKLTYVAPSKKKLDFT